MSKDAMPEYQLSHYRPEHREGILTLLGNEPHKRLLWDWQFAAATTTDNALVVATCGNEVVGFNGAMPIRVQVDGQINNALWSCDFNVAARYRGLGLGKAIKQELHHRCDHIMSLGISDFATPVLEKSGWRKGSPVYSLRRYSGWRLDRRLVLRPWQWCLSLSYFGLPRVSALRVHAEWRLPGDQILAGLWSRMALGAGALVVRDGDYLRWRYGAHPLGQYRYLLAHQGDQIVAMAVVRCQGEQAIFVDYIGPRDDEDVKRALFLKWLQLARSAVHLSFSSSDRGFVRIARSCGFRLVGQQRFYIHGQHAEVLPDWFIMPGDSDGELLAAARASIVDVSASHTTATMSVGWFETANDRWQCLLSRSDADPLFMSWHWLYSWWETWAHRYKLQLHLVVQFDLVKLRPMLISPMYIAYDARGARCIQFIGSSWRLGLSMRTEYCDFIIDRTVGLEILRHHLASVLNADCDESVWCDIRSDGALSGVLDAYCKSHSVYRRLVKSESSYSIDVSHGFESYVECLGSSVRRKILTSRGRLAAAGVLEIRSVSSADWCLFEAEINNFHLPRWGKPCFNGLMSEFHQRFLQRWPSAAVRLSALYLSGTCVSVLYDLVAGETVYNIQQGYSSEKLARVSLGTMHLGFAIEQAALSGNRVYHLLAGKGKHADYKRELATATDQLWSIQIVSSRIRQLAYKVHDIIHNLLKA